MTAASHNLAGAAAERTQSLPTRAKLPSPPLPKPQRQRGGYERRRGCRFRYAGHPRNALTMCREKRSTLNPDREVDDPVVTDRDLPVVVEVAVRPAGSARDADVEVDLAVVGDG